MSIGRNAALRAAGVLMLASAGVSAAAAQEAGLGVVAGRATDERGASHGGVTLLPTLAWSAPGSSLLLGGQVTAFGGGGLLGGLGARGEADVAALGPARVVVGGEARIAGTAAGYRAAAGAATARLRWTGAGWGLEAGPRLERAGEGRSESRAAPVGGLFPSPGADGALRWRGASGLDAAAWARGGPLAVRADWRVTTAGTATWTDWTASATARVDALTLEARGGLRAGGVEERWLGLAGAVALSGGMEALLEVGRSPSDPLTGRAGGEHAAVGLRVRTGRAVAAAGVVQPAAAAGVRRIELRAEPGARVEVLGDWTGWRPQPVPEGPGGVRVVEVRLGPGVHRFAFRVDGRWRVPPGYETERDEFGGRRAVLRVGGASQTD